MHLSVHEVARAKTLVTLFPASVCARELNGLQISTAQALIFSLEYQCELKLNAVYIEVPG